MIEFIFNIDCENHIQNLRVVRVQNFPGRNIDVRRKSFRFSVFLSVKYSSNEQNRTYLS